MDPVLNGPMGIAVALGALALATDALDVVRGLGKDRGLSRHPVLCPRRGALLAGQERLPPPPDEPPAELTGSW
jgi:hypothetical protein